MPYSALDGSERIHVARLSSDEVENVYKPRGFAYHCPACQGEMRIVSGEQVSPHFRHRAAQCPYDFSGDGSALHGELQERLQRLLQEELSLPQVELEVPLAMEWRDRGRVVDVMIGEENKPRIALEIQLSKILPSELEERTRDYLKAGIAHVFWFVGDKTRELGIRASQRVSNLDAVSIVTTDALTNSSTSENARSKLWSHILGVLTAAWLERNQKATPTELSNKIFHDDKWAHVFTLACREHTPLLGPRALLMAQGVELERALELSRQRAETRVPELKQQIQNAHARLNLAQSRVDKLESKLAASESKLAASERHIMQLEEAEGIPSGPTASRRPYFSGRDYAVSVLRLLNERPNSYQMLVATEHWFPKSHTEWIKPDRLHIARWLAVRKGILSDRETRIVFLEFDLEQASRLKAQASHKRESLDEIVQRLFFAHVRF